MDDQPPALPVAELQYQSDLQIRAADLIPLIAKWCIVVGAIPVVELGLLLIALYPFPPSFGRSFGRIDRPALVTALAWLGSGAWLMVLGICIVQGKTRHLRWLWIALSVCIVSELAGEVAQVISYRSLTLSGGPSRVVMVGRSVLTGMASCVPAAILWSILRQRAIPQAIDELN